MIVVPQTGWLRYPRQNRLVLDVILVSQPKLLYKFSVYDFRFRPLTIPNITAKLPNVLFVELDSFC